MTEPFDELISLVSQLKLKNIDYSLASYSQGSVMVMARVPGQYWEIELFEDGNLEIEVFVSDGQIHDRKKLKELWDEFST